MPVDILFKTNKNGDGLFNFNIPFKKGGGTKNKTIKTTKKKTTKKKTTKTTKKKTTKKKALESSLLTYGSAKSGFIGATKCGELDKHRKHSLKGKKLI